MKTIAFSSGKGGTGKSTSATNLALQLMKARKRVLFIDTDPNFSATQFWFGLMAQERGLGPESCGEFLAGHTIQESLMDGDFRIGIHQLDEFISVIPCLEDFEAAYNGWNLIGKEISLRTELEGVADQYDYCIIDSPSGLGSLVVLGLSAAQAVIVTVRLEEYDVGSVQRTLTAIEQVRKAYNPGLQSVLVQPTQTTYANRQVNEMAGERLVSLNGSVLDPIKMATSVSQNNVLKFPVAEPLKEYRDLFLKVEAL